MGVSKVINMWSGPRNVSTALMYSFRQRSDTVVVDEPLYGHYLKVSAADHPAAQEVMTDMDCDGDRVMRALMQHQGQRPCLFLKQMAHHLRDIDRSFLGHSLNLLLIRDPAQMLPSLQKQIPQPTLRDTGLALQWELLQELQNLGQSPAVIDARDLLLDPPGVLGSICEALGLKFERTMLHWPRGAKPEDGVWAPHWYHRVHETTGFGRYQHKTRPFPPALESLLEESRDYYQKLYRYATSTRATHT
ncbi:MAG: sulfotransferase family protein [Gammaproteobacteria bacterium]|nr:sulfotransferase family protein [Gammaproteobacteria bacterium]